MIQIIHTGLMHLNVKLRIYIYINKLCLYLTRLFCTKHENSVVQLLWNYFIFKWQLIRIFPNWKLVCVLNSSYYFSLSECLERTSGLAKGALNFTEGEIYSLAKVFSLKSLFKSERVLTSNMVLTIWSLKSVQLTCNKPVHTSQKAKCLSIIRPNCHWPLVM